MQSIQHTAPPELLRESPIGLLAPRSLREKDAATYIGFSPSYLRNLRVADMRSLRRGQSIKGPVWITVQTAVRYLKEDLDNWLNAIRIDFISGDPAQKVNLACTDIVSNEHRFAP